jgi:hypothetical protein
MELVQAYIKEFAAGLALREASGTAIFKPGIPKARRAKIQEAQQRNFIDSMSKRAGKELELCLKVQKMLSQNA